CARPGLLLRAGAMDYW
nr:immunoglobulin heavy chain junction region [Mus musculus]